MLVIPEDIDFGSELEFFAPCKVHEQVASALRAGMKGLSFVNHYEGKGITSEEVLYSSWILKPEHLTLGPHDLLQYDEVLRCEVSSPLLNGATGLKNLGTFFNAVDSIGCFANIDCAYHLRVSPAGRIFTQTEIGNFATAVAAQKSNYTALIAAHRDTNINCFDYLSHEKKRGKINLSEVNTAEGSGRWRNAVEFRGKEAAGFDIDGGAELLDHTALVVTFTSLAIKDPRATFEEAADMVFAHRPAGRPDSLASKLWTNSRNLPACAS